MTYNNYLQLDNNKPADSTEPKMVKRLKSVLVIVAYMQPYLALVYIGRIKRAVLYFILTFVTTLLNLYISYSGHPIRGLGVIVTAVNGVAIYDAQHILKSTNSMIQSKWYWRWYVVGSLCCLHIAITVFEILNIIKA